MTPFPTAPQGERLEACPFCGGAPVVSVAHVECPKCMIGSPLYFSGTRQAVAFWNTRTPAPSPSAPIDADPGAFAEYGPHASSNEDRERVDQCGGAGQRVLRDLYAAERVLGLRDTEPSAPSPHAAQRVAYGRCDKCNLMCTVTFPCACECHVRDAHAAQAECVNCAPLRRNVSDLVRQVELERTAVATLTRENAVIADEKRRGYIEKNAAINALHSRLARAMEVAEWATRWEEVWAGRASSDSPTYCRACEVDEGDNDMIGHKAGCEYIKHRATLAAIREEQEQAQAATVSDPVATADLGLRTPAPASPSLAEAVREIDEMVAAFTPPWTYHMLRLAKHWPALKLALAQRGDVEAMRAALAEIASLSVHTHGKEHRMYFGKRDEVLGEASVVISQPTANTLHAAAIRALSPSAREGT